MIESLELFSQVCVAILLEAAPFLLLGSLASGLFEVFVPRSVVERLLPKKTLPGILAGIVLGMAVPCCECGIVPLIRRLLAKGVPPATAVTFMLAGPVINPVVMASTYVAFQGSLAMVAMRCGLVGLIAGVLGASLRNFKSGDLLLSRQKPIRSACGCGDEPLFGSLDTAISPADIARPSLASRLDHAVRHAQEDFLDMFRILLIGAMIAAGFKVLAPVGLISLMEGDLLASVTGMMGLAVVLSLCSQADAFVAASFSGFPLAAKLAFLVLGPVLDLKLMFMWRGVFKPEVVRLLVIVPLVMVFAFCMVFGAFGRVWP